MERRIDLSKLNLDVAADAIAARRPTWVASGLLVDAPTWMDNDVAWPAPLVTDRADVQRPRSLGIRLRGEGDVEAEFVLYAGGWADASWVLAGSTDPVNEYVELERAEEFVSLLDRVVVELLGWPLIS